MNKTTIEWVKNPDGTQGFTWNPLTGCKNHTPEGLCLGGMFPCYAYKLAHRRLRERYLANRNIAELPFPQGGEYGVGHLSEALNDPFYPRFWAENAPSCRLYDPAFRYKPSGIFVCDMGELFGDWVPIGWQEDVFEIIRTSPQHRFYLLTKQAQNLPQWSPFPDNCWVGVTVTNQSNATKYFNDFAKVEATVKYLSIEPMLGKVDISPYLPGWVNAGTIFENPEGIERYDVDGALVNHINWVIIGAQTKPYKPPKIEWVEEIVRATDKAGIPIFIKDNLAPYARNLALYPTMRVGDKGWDTLRQELPE